MFDILTKTHSDAHIFGYQIVGHGHIWTIVTPNGDEWHVSVFDGDNNKLKDPQGRILMFYNTSASQASDTALEMVLTNTEATMT